jgi:predicted TIM-barrel fold metal-dependent hydrolase
MDVRWENTHKARDLARKFPRIPMVLDHCGLPVARTKEYFEAWRKGIATLAQAENTVCKISGLGIYDQKWTVESIRPWVLACIEAFGPKRCIFATNWPVDKLFSTYDDLLDAYAKIVAGFTLDEQKDMFSRNAVRLYRLNI